MRRFLIFTGLMVASFAAQVQAQVSVQSFTWERNARFELRFTGKGGPVVIKGDLRDGARESYQTKDLQTTVELKSYTTELFLVATITSENDDTGYIFLFEHPVDDWLVMNRAPIRARKIDIMNDFETAVKDFKATTDHAFANILRKMVEYFETNPNKRLQDLLTALETRDESLRTIPRPRASSRRNGQGGVIPGNIPSDARPVGPAEPRNPGEPLDLNPDDADDDVLPNPPVRRRPAPVQEWGGDPYAPRPRQSVPYGGNPGRYDPTTDPDSDWNARERDRARRERERMRRERQNPGTGGYYPDTQRPRYNTDPSYPRPQYSPPSYYQQRPQRGFFDNIFGQ